MGNSESSKIFIEVGKEMVKAAVKVMTEGEASPTTEGDRIKNFVSSVLNLPDEISDDDLDKAITEIDPEDDITNNAERLIRAAAIYVYTQRKGEEEFSDFWLACNECLVKLGMAETTGKPRCATPAQDHEIARFCSQLAGCDYVKNVNSVGTEFSLWTITRQALKLLEDFLEEKSIGRSTTTEAAYKPPSPALTPQKSPQLRSASHTTTCSCGAELPAE